MAAGPGGAPGAGAPVPDGGLEGGLAGPGAPTAPGLRHGAFHLGHGRTRFSVWAPRASRVSLEIDGGSARTLRPAGAGYHQGVFTAPPGTRYRYLLDGRGPFADPASRSQPDGVHGPSEVVETAPAATTPGWHGLPAASLVICEVHVGTFSAAGTFDGVADALGDLAGAGYTAVELMPVAAFPGERNWGYDGVFPYAVQGSYGGRDGLLRLCDAAHRRGMAVVLDVVYNHLGPDGSVLGEFGPYLTDRYRTPWGEAVNFDGPGSDEVRRFFVEQALSSVRELDVDGFRLDAVHEIADRTASPFLAELVAAVQAEAKRAGRVLTVVAESTDDDPELVAPAEAGGTGCDGVWNDELHHALRVSLTGQQDRYFGDYRGVADLATALTEGFVVAGRTVPSRGRRHGARPARPLGGDRLVVFAQNHDQIGNGGLGRRLAAELPLEAQFPIAALVLCSGWVPLRFMGEEYGETAPFHYFTDHEDPGLAEAVRSGRRDEVGRRGGVDVPDPQDPATFAACRPDQSLAREGLHAELLAWQQELLGLRRERPALGSMEPGRSACWVDEAAGALVLMRRADPYLGGAPVVVACVLGPEPANLRPPLLAGCTAEVLASRGAAPAAGGLIGPGPDGSLALRLDGYGVAVAEIATPGEAPAGASP